ncbi:MAG: SDR family NAD(P)-dependent oxidoreductase [Pseudomonadota bacterium]
MSIEKNSVAVITGAGSGIGRALALAMSARGCRLALSDVNETGLKETADQVGTEVITEVFDVADRKAFEAFGERVRNQFGQADYVFNNAGVALLQPVQDMRYEDLEWMMGINFYGVVHGTHAFLDDMLKRGSGHIINVSSLYGLIGWPANSAYCAAKFAVRGYTEVMRQDLQGTGVKAHCVHPGGIKTNIVKSSRFTRDDRGREDKAQLVKDFDKIAMTSPEKAAEIIINGVERGNERIVVGNDAKVLSFLQRLKPKNYMFVIRFLERFIR